MNQNDINPKVRMHLEKFEFKCQKCSLCCRKDPGSVFLTEEDVLQICGFLNLELPQFVRQYCRILYKSWKKILSLTEKANYDCIFWDNGCKIYKVRPLQCRAYPYWPRIVESQKSWDEEANHCPGINIKGELSLEQKMSYYLMEKNVLYLEWDE